MTLKIVVGLIVLIALLPNLLGPLLIWKIQRIPARIRFKPHDEASFLESRDAQFQALDADIRALGFAYLGSSFMRDTQTEANFSLYTHPSDQSCAMVVNMASKIKSLTYVEFTQMYADGSLLSVSNVDMPSTYPRMQMKIGARYPDVHRSEELYARFRALRSGLDNTARPVPYSTEEGFRLIEDFMDMESDHMVELGYCHPQVDADGRRRLTLKGAYLLTWRSITPGKPLVDWLDKRRSGRLLAAAG